MITERTGVIQTLPGNVGCVAEDILNELAEEDDWHRERERYPEPPPEHPLVTRVIGVGPVIFVLSLVNVRAVVVVVFVPPSMGVGSLGVAVSGLDFVIVV